MKHLVYIIIAAILASCSQTSPTKIITENINTEIDTIKLKTEIIQTAIDYENLQWFYIDTISLVLTKNENTEGIINLRKFNSQAILKNSQEIKEEQIIYYLSINKLIFNSDSAFIELEYPSQGAVAKIKLNYLSGLWKIYSHEIYEY